MPRLWNETIEAHRRDVRDAVMEATFKLVGHQGLRSVTMSQIAQAAGIGRATLYKYFPDVESILAAWHEAKVATHLASLVNLRDQPGSPAERILAVLEAYALIQFENHGTELAALLHRGEHVAQAQHHLHDIISKLIAEGAETGYLRSDVASHELATYCFYALTAASSLPSKAAVRRLVRVTLEGLRPARTLRVRRPPRHR
ncbi:MAG TPA: TetR/AcrR family transcriptional regulator [Myxococcaceae bacterium]|nr:TetR/AcrR family transcriptional regulator [Myxococcaceae bacterium]